MEDQKREGPGGLGKKDWELSEEYYGGGQERELSLESFMTSQEEPGKAVQEGEGFQAGGGPKLQETVAQVRLVLGLAAQGMTVAQIASQTGFPEQLVYNIQVCAQGFREDDQIAVAHLVMMDG